MIVQGDLPDEIQDKIYRPSVEEAGYAVDLDFKKPDNSFSENGGNGEVEFEVRPAED